MASITPTFGKRRSHLVFFIVLAGHVLLISSRLATGDGRSVLEVGLLTLFSPFQRAGAATIEGIRSVWNGYVDLRGVRAENQELREKVARLEQAKWMDRDRVASYDRMAQIVGLTNQFQVEPVVAEVIGLDATAWFQSLTVNRGEKDGVELNGPVIGPGGLVGRVIAVGEHVARVQLISDRASAVGVLLVRSRARGIVSGVGEGVLELKYVSNLEDVEAGDLIITSGVDGIYPKGLAVGRVESVRDGPKLFKEIALVPAAGIERLEEVFILAPVDNDFPFTKKVE